MEGLRDSKSILKRARKESVTCDAGVDTAYNKLCKYINAQMPQKLVNGFALSSVYFCFDGLTTPQIQKVIARIAKEPGYEVLVPSAADKDLFIPIPYHVLCWDGFWQLYPTAFNACIVRIAE